MSADKLLVALDVDTGNRALELAAALREAAAGFKIGSRLFTAEGPALVRRMVDSGMRIFLDLKFHDIPNTVEQAVEAATETGAWMINVHASGGRPMMEAALRGAAAAAQKLGRPAPLVIAVTALTSMDEVTLHDVGVERPMLDHVISLARLAQTAGLAGVVASALETGSIRAACGPDFVIVTPGIRGLSAGSERNDQIRTMGPAEAVRAGASYIVVGRPIIGSPDPRAAAAAIAEELEEGTRN
jgi:orotidine-5'-phosphate decarboxylase